MKLFMMRYTALTVVLPLLISYKLCGFLCNDLSMSCYPIISRVIIMIPIMLSGLVLLANPKILKNSLGGFLIFCILCYRGMVHSFKMIRKYWSIYFRSPKIA